MTRSIAPLAMAGQRRMGGLAGPLGASGTASNGEPVTVELFIGGTWVDITAGGYVMVRDDSGKISITYGITGGEGSQTERAAGGLQLRNTDGRFSPRNPSGPYYGQIGRNTRCRVSVPDGNGGISYRLWGEVGDWAKDWDSTGNDVWVDAAVYGPMQRLAQGPAPERSVIYQAVTDPLPASVQAYWPCEDPSGATALASALPSGSEMHWTGTPTLASYTGFGASDPLPDLTSARLTGGVTRYDDPTATQVRLLAHIPVDGLADGKVLAAIVQSDTGGAAFWELYYSTTSRSLILRQNASDGSLLGVELAHTLDVRGLLLYVSIELEESGASVNRAIRLKNVLTSSVSSVTDTAAATSLTRVTRVEFGRASESAVGPFGTTNLPGVAIGHITVENAITAIDALGVRLNPIGETAGRRIQRLCAEQGVAFDWVGDLDDTVPMGAQDKQNLHTLVQEACLADGGLLYENRAVLGLGYRTRASLYNQDPALTLSYSGYTLSEVPAPVEDDRQVQNILTVTVSGVTATYEETAGALGTGTIGKYGETSGLTLNLSSTDTGTLLDHAAWRVHLGTVDEERFPRISVNLAHPSITPEMKRAILGLRLGDRIQITNPPTPWLAPDTIDQLMLGTEESITHFEHRLTFICAPSSPYNTIGVADDTDARIDIDGSELVAAVSSSATALTAAPSAGESMLWMTDSADWPFDVKVGGEVMTVTAVTDWLADTFTRSVSNGWGTPDTGSAWSNVGGGASSDYSVNGSAALHTLSTVDITRRSAVTAASADFDIYGSITTSDLATGDSLFGAVTARMVDASNMMMVRLEFTTGNAIIMSLRRMVASAQTDLGSVTLDATHVAGTFIRVRFQSVGNSFKAKAWVATDTEPPAWMVTAADSALGTAAQIGTRSVRTSSNTNAATVSVQYDNFNVISPQTLTVTRSINGVTKAHAAGADIRLAYPTYTGL